MKIILSGASGRMGQEISKLVGQDKKTKIVLSVGRAQPLKSVKADVVIDFSQPEFLNDVLDFATKTKTPVVIGTTGLDLQKQKALRRAARKIPVLWAPNMSVGIQIVRAMLKSFAGLKGYNFSIEDIHHVNKKDSPSGTARYLKLSLERQTRRKNIPIRSVREGDVFGIHRVIAAGKEEKIVIEHEALNRTVFARGALICARWLIKKKKGLYGMESVMHG